MHTCRLLMTATGLLRAHRVRYLMGILSPECAPPVPSAHFPPHYTAPSMSVVSYASISTHVMIAVTTIAMVTFASTFTVCIHYKGRNLQAHTKIPAPKKHCSYPQPEERSFPNEGMLHSCIHMNDSVDKNVFFFSIDCDLQLHTTEALLQELNTMVTSHKKQLKPYLGHINSLLTNAILKCKAAIEKAPVKPTATPEPFANKENIAPGKKNRTSMEIWENNKNTLAGKKSKHPLR